MQLIYLSPVAWSSFAQRPHKFVEWFHTKAGGDILWVDPYPTRFPLLSDIRRLSVKECTKYHQPPPWLKVIYPFSLPIEPLPASGLVNGIMWHSVLKSVDTFARRDATIVAIGKPSVLALHVLKQMDQATSIYDAMDDFPFFYSGLSRLAMSRREKALIGLVTHVLVSSTTLRQRWKNARPDAQLVPNGLDVRNLPAPKTERKARERRVFGYVGTIGPWFDWKWTITLARTRPMDMVRLIGPMFFPSPYDLPKNVEILPPCRHDNALGAMQDFDVGLIPFKKNKLTASVDPVKYYEYRALGLPVISTSFGEMAFRCGEDGSFISMDRHDINVLVDKALLYRADINTIYRFSASNSWEARFAEIKIIR